MSTPTTFLCESCGVTTREPAHLPRGRHLWCVCPRCNDALQARSMPVFGKPLRDLPDPSGGHAGWWSYRFACEELGYTLFHADTRTERDTLHRRWNQWLAAMLLLAQQHDILLYRNTHEGNAFVESWGRVHGVIQVPEELAMWLLPRICHESKRDLLTGAPSRATLEAAAGVPKRGALAKQTT